ncbi:hypothetical protein ACS0TY_010240 [Phlomoides rotata]
MNLEQPIDGYVEQFIGKADSPEWEKAKKEFQLEYYVVKKLGDIPVNEAFTLWMENHDHWKDIWKKTLLQAAELKVNMLTPLPTKYEVPRKSNSKIDYIQMNELLHHCAHVGGYFNTHDLRQL